VVFVGGRSRGGPAAGGPDTVGLWRRERLPTARRHAFCLDRMPKRTANAGNHITRCLAARCRDSREGLSGSGASNLWPTKTPTWPARPCAAGRKVDPRTTPQQPLCRSEAAVMACRGASRRRRRSGRRQAPMPDAGWHFQG